MRLPPRESPGRHPCRRRLLRGPGRHPIGTNPLAKTTSLECPNHLERIRHVLCRRYWELIGAEFFIRDLVETTTSPIRKRNPSALRRSHPLGLAARWCPQLDPLFSLGAHA